MFAWVGLLITQTTIPFLLPQQVLSWWQSDTVAVAAAHGIPFAADDAGHGNPGM